MKKRILFFIAILVVTITPKSWADTAKTSTSDIVVLDPIVVTSSRIGRNLTEASYTVKTIGSEEIRKTNAKSVPDLLKTREGMYVYDDTGTGTGGRINMRGFWGGMSTHQLILVDGIPQNKGGDKLVDWDLIPLDNIERIEILRGPASALYGDNAMSGVINVITKRSGDLKTKTSFSCGTFNTQDYKISSSQSLEKIGYRLDINKKTTDGFRKHADYENINMAGKLDFSLSKTQNLLFDFGYHQKEIGAYPWSLTELQIAEDRRQARPGSENDTKTIKKTDFSMTYSQSMDKWLDFMGTFYYRYEDTESFYTSGSSPTSTQEELSDENTYGLLARTNLDVKILKMKHFFTTGMDLETNNLDSETYDAPNQIRSDIDGDYNADRYKVGLYLQDEINLTDPLKLILGIRYDWVQFDFSDLRNNGKSRERKMTDVNPKCGIVYTYWENSNLYANYSQAFRTPTLSQMFTYGSVSNPDLSAEKAQNYEFGVRHQFTDSLKTDVSLYWMEIDNEIWYDRSVRKYKNYGETLHKGLESSLNFEILDGVNLFANYTYTEAKNRNGTDDGKYLTNVPVHKGAFGLRFLSDYGFGTHLTLSSLGDSYVDSANNHNLCGYTTVDTGLSYTYKQISAFFNIDNLFDREYNSHGSKSLTGTKKFNPAPGRTFNFGVEVEF
ncbi:MAG: TonB-dependent receptor [Candidatus Omnitrophota bacterium]